MTGEGTRRSGKRRHTQTSCAVDGVAWVSRHTRPLVRLGPVLACHGTPEDDATTLIERIDSAHVRWATNEELTPGGGMQPLGVLDAQDVHTKPGTSTRTGRWSACRGTAAGW
jgi:hypothetical protein